SRKLTRDDPSVSNMFRNKQPEIIEDIDEIGPASQNYYAWKREGVRSIVSLPLVSEGEVFGIIGTASGKARRYTQTEVDAMAILAAQAGAAITNARLYEQLKEADLAKDEFLATLSHELRTPLTPILGWMRILSRFGQTDPLLAQGFEVIERNARQQAELINDLLDLTRIISGKIELFREPASLANLIQSAVSLVRTQAEARRLRLEFKSANQEISCSVDSLRIQQILTNLLSNAIKFTPEGGCVELALKGPGHLLADGSTVISGVVIEVADTGIGIEPEVLPRVFDRFFQGQGGLNRKYGGLGLGLAITRALVERHGGRITATSPGPSLGSTFAVHLPESLVQERLSIPEPGLDAGSREHLSPVAEVIASASPSSREDERESAPLASSDSLSSLSPAWEDGFARTESSGLRLLIIEDSQDTIDVLTRWLSACGFEVISTTKAAEAIHLAESRKPHLVISDIGMPEVDGYQLVKVLRKLDGLEQIPAIALTGYAREEDREFALKAGYNAHIPKPADMDELLEVIRGLTARAQPRSPAE
ncbi:MAG TPA: ATP-binding protein, partial [Blastocatellia bacterium]|nr:ATP-binding protein [Blastocatellia bacterium]